MQEVKITLITRHSIQTPILVNRVYLERKRAGAPACLRFSVMNDQALHFEEGDVVKLEFAGEAIFSGFVFGKRRRNGGSVGVVAYDQIRYLKNRDTYQYTGTTASGLVRMIGQDWGISLGEITDTEYVLPEGVEEDRPLLDMIQDALDITAKQTGDVFVLHDAVGALCLEHVKDTALDIVIDERRIGGFDYTSTIDRDVYSAVSLHRPIGEGGTQIQYETRDDFWFGRWGMLRYRGRAQEERDGMEQAENILKQYARKKRILRIFDAAGDVRVRGGTLLPVQLNLGDVIVDQFLMVERVVHCFEEGLHTMELSLVGGDFRD